MKYTGFVKRFATNGGKLVNQTWLKEFANKVSKNKTGCNSLVRGIVKKQPDELHKQHIIEACKFDNKAMIELHGDSNRSFDFNSRGETPIIVALENKNYEIVDLLLKYHAKVNLIDIKGETVLHSIINMPNWNNRHKTNLSFADDNDELLCVRNLIAHGANPYQKDDAGFSAIEYAKSKGFHVLAETMRSSAVDLKGRGKN